MQGKRGLVIGLDQPSTLTVRDRIGDATRTSTHHGGAAGGTGGGATGGQQSKRGDISLWKHRWQIL
jgi:hypothetical protein